MCWGGARESVGVAALPSLLLCGYCRVYHPAPLPPPFGAAWRPHLLYPLYEGGGGVDFSYFLGKTGEKSKKICAIQKNTLSLQTKGERPFA